MQVKKYNLTKSGRKFTGKDGQEKTLKVTRKEK